MNYIWIIISGLIILLLLYCIIILNIFTKWKNKLKEAFSTLDVYLKKRWDLIPNLVNCLKEESNFEKNTLEEIVKIRNNNYDNQTNQEKFKNAKIVEEKLNKLLFLAESYPELKSIQSYQNLMVNLTKIEDEIANARKYYNAIVRIYNTKLETFPNNIFAKLFSFQSAEMFSIEKNEKENVEVKLDEK